MPAGTKRSDLLNWLKLGTLIGATNGIPLGWHKQESKLMISLIEISSSFLGEPRTIGGEIRTDSDMADRRWDRV